jgi:tryptophan 2,3-dioxygenase
MGYQGEEGRRLTYGSYLHVPDLLRLQAGLSEAHDELLFIVVHQAYELWFKVIIHELEATIERIHRDDLVSARHYLRRIKVIEDLLVEQVETLETMTPADFLAFRSELAPASGFQSVQFREIEFLSGLKEPGYLKLDHSPEDTLALKRRFNEPSIWDAFTSLLRRRGISNLADIYRERDQHRDVFELAEALLEHDEGFRVWRMRHVLMVERQIGDKPGTGGSTGVAYLQGTLKKRFFPELWEVRSQL